MGVGDALGRVGFTWGRGGLDLVPSVTGPGWRWEGAKKNKLGRRLFAEKKLQQPTQLCTHVTVT